MQTGKANIYGQSLIEVGEWLKKTGHNPDRANAFFRRLYGHREKLGELEHIKREIQRNLLTHLDDSLPQIIHEERSEDGTIKFALRGLDESLFEAVYIPTENATRDRATLCISSQTGCSLGCTFCYTSTLKHNRDLETAELVGQLLVIDEYIRTQNIGPPVSNIVFMGMGEPLLNFDNVVRATEIFLFRQGLDFSHRKVTISTAGIVPRILELADLVHPVLAISLHATTDDVRSTLMPVNKRWPIAEVIASLKTYTEATTRPITIEYLLIDQVNDTPEDALRLAALLKDIPAKINLIPLNPHERTSYQPPPIARTLEFQELLRQEGCQANLRRERGSEVAGACGLLGAKAEKMI
ncbi:23S rRNA (adenine(2503)-C(2))-methyltransferase RlmN [Myxococcota bacterium]|nr:23S rRNA (adenine(2503)-C(2))-methyltransferase RlmN [Myxococcota bacterium]